jgi:hypothetical protein
MPPCLKEVQIQVSAYTEFVTAPLTLPAGVVLTDTTLYIDQQRIGDVLFVDKLSDTAARITYLVQAAVGPGCGAAPVAPRGSSAALNLVGRCLLADRTASHPNDVWHAAAIAAQPDTFFSIRATRASPTGHAARDERRGTYGAALAQFEELLEAARRVGPHARALPLFYALSQAGRALAARGLKEAWQLKGHGLSCPDLSTASILQTEVLLARAAKQQDSFRGVSAATGSELPASPMTIGALWAALPRVSELLVDVPEAEGHERPFILVPDQPYDDVPVAGLWTWDRVRCSLVGRSHETFDSFVARIKLYPFGDQLRLERVQAERLVVAYTPHGYGVRAVWPTESPDQPGFWATVERLAPLDPVTRLRWWRPLVAGAAMNDLMTWWALLFALSMFTRYEPANWSAALDLDVSLTAAPLRRLLDAATDAIPELVLQVLDPWYHV